MKRLLVAAVLCGLAAGAAPTAAQDDMREERIRFAPGESAATLNDRIRGRDAVLYRLDAREGQRMTVSLDASNSATYFNVYAPGRGPGDEALAVSEQTGPMVPDLNRFDGTLPRTGTYTISVYLYRSAARRDEASDFTLTVAIRDRASQRPEPPAEAAFWRVTGLAPGNTLNLRTGPGTSHRVVETLAPGTILRDRGCEDTASGTRWCRVHPRGRPETVGWVSARYLERWTRPRDRTPTPLPGDALVPGTRFNATGALPCARTAGQPMRDCRFGVIRYTDGGAEVMVFWPEGGSRVITFEGGVPVRYDEAQADGGARLTWRQEDGLFRIAIGAQRFEIIDAIVFGG